jgi:hypothetical protein
MTLREPRLAAGARLFTTLAMIAGVVLTAAGSATVTGPLPYFNIRRLPRPCRRNRDQHRRLGHRGHLRR